MKFEEHWAIARQTKDCGVYDRAVNGMIQSATNKDQHNAAINLSLNGKTPTVIETLDKITEYKED